MIEYLNFLDSVLRLDIDDDALPAFAGVRRFFRHLLHPHPAAEPTFRIAVRAYRPDDDVPAAVWATEQAVIRRSSAAEFTFDAHVVDSGRRRVYLNRTTYLDTPRDARSDPCFEVRVSPGSTIQVIDFLRDLVIRHEESLGTVVLHASGATDGTGALAVAGPKGAGKTTTLLSVLHRPGWSYFTGDKLFCRPGDGGVEVHPWRDYPYVGVGTIRADPRLTELVRREVDPGLDRRAPTDKLLMDPDMFESWLGSPFCAAPRRLSAILLPQVRPGEPLRTRALTDPNERWAHLNKIIDRQADTTFFTWQSYLVPDYTRFFASLARLHRHLDGVPLIRLTGTLDVDPDAVLERHRRPPAPPRGAAAAPSPPAVGTRAPRAGAGRRTRLRVCVVGPAGSGKSTCAAIIEELAAARGLTHARVKLAAPLYELQERVYQAAGVPLPGQAQDQQLMEALAGALRRIRPESLVDDFLGRLAATGTDVVVNDDLRDPHIDAVRLRAQGFRIIRLTADPEVRAARLTARGDLSRADGSTRELDLIEPDAVVDNSGDLAACRQALTELIGCWL